MKIQIPRNKLKRTMFALSASALTMAFGSAAYADSWDGGGGDGVFSNGLNWNLDTVPNSTTTADINGAFTVNRGVANTSVRNLNVQGGAVLNVNAGTQSDSFAGNTVRNFVGNGSTGTVNLSGATTSYDIGHMLAIGHSTNSNGQFIQTGGALAVSRSGTALIGSHGGIFTNSVSMTIGGSVGNTNIAGLYQISGGSLNTRIGVVVGTGGTFEVVGSNATAIRLGGNNTDAGLFALSSVGTLKMTIDGGGITPIFVEALAGTSGNAAATEFRLGSTLDMGFNVPAFGGTWTLLELEGQQILDGGLALAAGDAAAGWSFLVDNTGPNGLLTASFIPEPTTFALVFGGIGMLLMRRRRR